MVALRSIEFSRGLGKGRTANLDEIPTAYQQNRDKTNKKDGFETAGGGLVFSFWVPIVLVKS